MEQLRAAAEYRPRGYLEDVIARGSVTSDGRFVELSSEAYAELRRTYSPNGTVAAIRPPQSTKLGDKIARVATPIARALKMPCIDPVTEDLRPESGCAKMKKRLNEGMPLGEALRKRLKGE